MRKQLQFCNPLSNCDTTAQLKRTGRFVLALPMRMAPIEAAWGLYGSE